MNKDLNEELALARRVAEAAAAYLDERDNPAPDYVQRGILERELRERLVEYATRAQQA
ncbi:hypothetical protein [Pseudonocardia spinosispora]|uniref:hypothetical protein n=1 Tax=Pseudonocardia spinosispora TaxID=103441 RepID=UPI0003FD8300|nr:hypothetical protein [Pseudonocardia spinosispora]